MFLPYLSPRYELGQLFPAPVADLADNDQLLLIELDGAARLPQVRVGQAQVAQISPFDGESFTATIGPF
jgi:hypothetical protein